MKMISPRSQANKLRTENFLIKKKKFKPDMRTANAVVSAVVFLQKSGIPGTPRNIRVCMMERSREPMDIRAKLSHYLSRGVELGILRRYNGIYKLGDFELKRRRKPLSKSNKTHASRQMKQSSSEKPSFTEQRNEEPSSSKSSGPVCSSSMGPAPKLPINLKTMSKLVREPSRQSILKNSVMDEA